MWANPEKSHLLFNCDVSKKSNLSRKTIQSKVNHIKKQLAVTINSQLDFKEHINNLCVKVNRKLLCVSYKFTPYIHFFKEKYNSVSAFLIII